MPSSIDKLVKQLKIAYPDISFVEDGTNRWNSDQQTIFYNPEQPQAELLLLHEVGHMLLKHDEYFYDAELLKIEVAAWAKVRSELAAKYACPLDEDFIESVIDDYRDWLFNRSTCPTCQQIGHQIDISTYHCLQCQTKWQVNQAKLTNLRRQKITPS